MSANISGSLMARSPARDPKPYSCIAHLNTVRGAAPDLASALDLCSTRQAATDIADAALMSFDIPAEEWPQVGVHLRGLFMSYAGIELQCRIW